MRKVILLILLFVFLSTTTNAQKRATNKERAIDQTDYIASRMNFSDAKKLFFFNTLFEKFDGTSNQIRGKNLSQEERKVIYKKENSLLYEKLSAEFSNKEIKEIRALTKEYNQSKKK